MLGRLAAALVFALALSLLLPPALAQGKPADEGWIALFNGKDLQGWRAVGGAKWTVENGILIGQQDNGKPGDLYTERTFRDFELRCTFKMVWPGNSGIWFRSKPEQGQLGYQMDILDKKEYGCTVGSVWSRGFLAKNTDESIVNLDGWNDVTITCRGNHIVVVLNGHKVADITNDRYAEGRIGLQVHAGDKYKNMKIMVKEMKIRPL